VEELKIARKKQIFNCPQFNRGFLWW